MINNPGTEIKKLRAQNKALANDVRDKDAEIVRYQEFVDELRKDLADNKPEKFPVIAYFILLLIFGAILIYSLTH